MGSSQIMSFSMLTLSAGLSQVRTVSSVRNGMQGDADTLQSEIEFDESVTGKTDVKGRAELSDLNDRIDAADNMVGEKLADVNEKVSDANQAAAGDESSDGADLSEENPLSAQDAEDSVPQASDAQDGTAAEEPAVYDETGKKVPQAADSGWNVLA